MNTLHKLPDHAFTSLADELGLEFEPRASSHDADDTFVSDNYERLKEQRVFSLGIPLALGGGGASHPELCNFLRTLARHCDATALSLSMHMHLVAAAVWRWQHGDQAAIPLLQRIAQEQLVLVSSGGSDWVQSSGRAEKIEQGFRINARKVFSSGSPAGDLLMTTAVYEDPALGSTVLHFAVPLKSPHVKIIDTWHTMGMRATGSHDVLIEDFFVPEQAVGLRRPAGQWHRFWDIISPLAWPLVMAVYVGVAESAEKKAKESSQNRQDDLLLHLQLGELLTHLAGAQLALDGMISLANNYDYEPSVERSNRTYMFKTLLAEHAGKVVDKAMEISGGSSYFRSKGLERLFRDVQGARFHPLQEKKQYIFSGRVALGLSPI